MIAVLQLDLVSGANMRNDWRAILEIEVESTLEDLHDAVLKALHFYDDHLHMFYVARSFHSKPIETYDDESEDPSDVVLAELFPLPSRYSLFYLYDFGDRWIVKVKRAKTTYLKPAPGVRYPRVIQEEGVRPHQEYDGEE